VCEILFWLALIFIAYTYIGYPIILILLSRLKPQIVKKHPISPTVSIIVAARNEEKNIVTRLRNLCEQDYPNNKFEIIIVSDNSTDKTNQLVKSFGDNRITLIALYQSSGKALAVNSGVAAAQGEILVFADARQRFEKNVIRELVANFSDPGIGCVSGEMVFLENIDSKVRTEMNAYWRYEKSIRKNESATGSVMGVSGSIYAMRRNLFKPLPAGTILDDVLTPMNIINQGYRVVFDSDAIAYDSISKDVDQEWRRKVRTLTGNWQLIEFSPWLIIPWSNKDWVRFLSHKIFRILVPFFLVMLLLLNMKLGGFFYRIFLSAQITCYSLATCGYFFSRFRIYKIFNVPYFFMVMNIAALFGFFYWVTGKDKQIWKVAYTEKR
jgi:poly-beta-1,6-N-acetyl-D-glucosamine synthase